MRPGPGNKSDSHRQQLGRRGEKIACRVLKQHGMKILARNFRCPAGEADIIALDTSTNKDLGAESVVFVEVKARATDKYADPESAVNANKRRHLKRVAEQYLAGRNAENLNVRFDVVAIVLGPDDKPRIKYVRDAF